MNDNNYKQSQLLLCICKKLNVHNFDDMTYYHKLIYLLQKCGVNCGYGYTWRIKGPYSPYLENIVNDIKDYQYTYNDNIKLKYDDIINQKIQKLDIILSDNKTNTDFLTILSSILYITDVHFYETLSYDDMKKLLMKYLPYCKHITNFDDVFHKAMTTSRSFKTR